MQGRMRGARLLALTFAIAIGRYRGSQKKCRHGEHIMQFPNLSHPPSPEIVIECCSQIWRVWPLFQKAFTVNGDFRLDQTYVTDISALNAALMRAQEGTRKTLVCNIMLRANCMSDLRSLLDYFFRARRQTEVACKSQTLVVHIKLLTAVLRRVKGLMCTSSSRNLMRCASEQGTGGASPNKIER